MVGCVGGGRLLEISFDFNRLRIPDISHISSNFSFTEVEGSSSPQTHLFWCGESSLFVT